MSINWQLRTAINRKIFGKYQIVPVGNYLPCIVDGDTATGDWTVSSQMKRREGGQIDTVLGRYSDEFIRTENGWKISRVGFERLA